MAKDKPNVLFILSDQHNAKTVGWKSSTVRTPNMDRMAKEGVRFDNAISQNPICTPSRVSWLSGQYCHNTGYYGLSGPHPEGLPTIIGHFRAAGYRTGAIGKIHCPAYWVEDDCDLFHDTCGTSIGGRSEEYSAYLKKRGLTDLEDHARMNEFGEKGKQAVDARPSKVSYEDGQEGWSARKGVEFMERNREAPFFLHISLPKPHQCYTPAARFWELYNESDIPLPPNADYDMKGKAPHLIRAAEHWREGDWQLFEPRTFEAGRLRKLHGYLGNVSHVDHAVGELLTWLQEVGLDQETIVIYSTDHGEYACEHGIMEKAPGICSDAVTRIPMIWRWPRVFKSGHVVRELVETVDLANTLCSLAGIKPLQTVDGKDISHLLRGESGQVRRLAVTEAPWSKSIRRGRFRLVYYPRNFFSEEYPDGFLELYDIQEDPWEMNNLFFDPQYEYLIREILRDFTDWLVTTTRPATIHPPVSKRSEETRLRYRNSVNSDGKINPALLERKGKNYL